MTIPRSLRLSIERWRDNLIDCDIVVDDLRRDAGAAEERLRSALQERAEAERHLRYLIDLADEVTAVAHTFGPEIATAHADALIKSTFQ